MTARKAAEAAEIVAEPKPTVREAMRFGAFASAKLLGGADGLDRAIEWVRLMETPEVRPRAGDLMLTTGFPIKDDREAQIRLVARIADAGGAGLVVRPMPYLRKLPAEMVTEANRLNVPLFTVAQDVQLIDLMAPLLERIINAEHWRLKRSMDIHRRFTELVLDGKGVTEICRTLADLLESAVVIEDASFHLLAHAGGSGDPHRKETIQRQGTPQRVLFDPQIQRMLREIEAKRGPVKVPAFPHVGMSRERLIAPIGVDVANCLHLHRRVLLKDAHNVRAPAAYADHAEIDAVIRAHHTRVGRRGHRRGRGHEGSASKHKRTAYRRMG